MYLFIPLIQGTRTNMAAFGYFPAIFCHLFLMPCCPLSRQLPHELIISHTYLLLLFLPISFALLHDLFPTRHSGMPSSSIRRTLDGDVMLLSSFKRHLLPPFAASTLLSARARGGVRGGALPAGVGGRRHARADSAMSSYARQHLLLPRDLRHLLSSFKLLHFVISWSWWTLDLFYVLLSSSFCLPPMRPSSSRLQACTGISAVPYHLRAFMFCLLPPSYSGALTLATCGVARAHFLARAPPAPTGIRLSSFSFSFPSSFVPPASFAIKNFFM